MAKNDSKRYYWLKLRTDFLESDSVDFLLAQKDGADYVVIYLQLCRLAINSNGKLARMLGDIFVPFDLEKITRDLKHWKIDTVRMAIELLKKLGYIGQTPEGVIVINEFQELVGSESASARRVRKHRQKKKALENQNMRYIVTDGVTQESKSIRVIESKSIRVKEKMNPLSESSSKRKEDEVEEEVKIGTKILIENGIIKDESHLVEEFNHLFKQLYEEHNKMMVNRLLSNIVSYAKFRDIKNPFKYIKKAIYNEIAYEVNNSKKMPSSFVEKNVNQKEPEQFSEEEIENLKKELENL